MSGDLQNVDELTLTNWVNYGAYNGDVGANNWDKEHFVFQRYPTNDGTMVDAGSDDGRQKSTGTIENVRVYDKTSGELPGYNQGTEVWDTGYSLRVFAKTKLCSGTDVAGMMVTQALYDSDGKLVGDPISIDPTTLDSYSQKTDVVNVSEIVYNISGAVTNGASSLEDLRERIAQAKENSANSPYKSLKMRYYVLLPEGLKLNTSPDNEEKTDDGAPKYHFWSDGTTDYLSANSGFYNNNSSKVVKNGDTAAPVSTANIPTWEKVSSYGSLSHMYWIAGGAVTHDLNKSNGQLVVFERTLTEPDWDQFNMWGNSTFFWGRGLSFSVVPTDGTGFLPSGSYTPQFWCQFLDGDDKPISLKDFDAGEAAVNDSPLDQDVDTLLYIPITFNNKHHEGGSEGAIEVDIDENSSETVDGKTCVTSEGTYRYPLTFEVTTGTSTGVVLWCNVEKMSGNFGTEESEWKGTVTGVDLGTSGRSVKVYVRDEYFDAKSYKNNATNQNLTQDNWVEVFDPKNYDNWSSVKAIAFYFEDQTFNQGEKATVSINMQAPKDEALTIGGNPKEPNKTVYTAYNELLVSDNHTAKTDPAPKQDCYFTNYVSVPMKVTPATYALPSTGGPGTILIYTTGMALVTAAAYLMYQTLRRGRKQGKGGAA